MARSRAPLDPAQLEDLRDLADHVGRFYVSDKNMERAQVAVNRAIASGSATERDRDAYLAAVRAYFVGFARDARSHLVDVEARLKHASQVQFNLSAERGVATSRVEAVQGVLAMLPGQPHAGQPHAGQPHAGQPHAGQPHA